MTSYEIKSKMTPPPEITSKNNVVIFLSKNNVDVTLSFANRLTLAKEDCAGKVNKYPFKSSAEICLNMALSSNIEGKKGWVSEVPLYMVHTA